METLDETAFFVINREFTSRKVLEQAAAAWWKSRRNSDITVNGGSI